MINRTYNKNSKFWLDSNDFENFSSALNENISLNDVVDRINILKTISNFVNIVTDESYPVSYAGNNSFSDGKSVTITSEAKDFDAICGLSLHEASHIKYSGPLYTIMKEISDSLNDHKSLNPYVMRMKNILMKNNATLELKSSFDYIHNLINILEDHRIDSITINKFPGYSGYYESLNIDYRFNDQSNKLLASQKFTEENFKSYQIQMFGYIIGNKFNRFLELRGSDEIIKLLGNTNDFINKTAQDIFDLAFDIFEVIISYVIKNKELPSENKNSNSDKNDENKSENKKSKNSNKNKSKDNNKESKEDLDNDSSNNESNENEKESDEENGNSSKNSDNENEEESNDENGNNESDENNASGNGQDLDSELENEEESNDKNDSNNKSSKVEKNSKPTTKTSLTKELEDFIEELGDNEIFKQIINNINNEYEKEIISESENELINLVSNNIFKIKNTIVDGKNIQVAVIPQINENIIKYFPSMFRSNTTGKILSNNSQLKYIQEGINLGKALGNKLVLMNDKHKSTNTRKKSGNIDSRLLAELGAKNYKIFNKTTTVEFEDQFVHISIDTSGSMSGSSIEESLKLAASIATVATYIKGLRVQVSIRSTSQLTLANANSYGIPYVVIIFDSKINNTNHILKYWPLIQTPGATPEGICFEAILDIITKSSKNRNSYFINICDGEPEFCSQGVSYHGDFAIRHGKEVVKKIINSGIKILAYMIDATDYSLDIFKTIYGQNNSHKIDVNNINDIARTLNRAFLNK